MKRNIFSAILVLILFFISCSKLEFKSLKGTWIEETLGTDTLIFTNSNVDGMFELKRGKELRGEYYLPKLNSGLWRYKISTDSTLF